MQYRQSLSKAFSPPHAKRNAAAWPSRRSFAILLPSEVFASQTERRGGGPLLRATNRQFRRMM
ncbi:hypothetical protein CFBP5877_17375 [Agrobacterium tumefaciens]|uniref:Uncharacterized protein n=1 Tax=Agrobacterium tumefaciens TaxID=358 RepID=A0AAE6BH37_AGRTU|nr:hypothetical protein CFBP5499_17835 [Agrobacterium tumefaciens]QCL80924.1 hypothetical protein CFBP5877_17375 [Agrobacterium tumefaciens]